MSWAQKIINLLDAAGTSTPFLAFWDGANSALAHNLLDESGAIVSPSLRTASVCKTVTPTITVSSAYTAGFCVGGLLTFANAARINGGSGLVQSVVITTKTALSDTYDIVFFNTIPTSTMTDKVLFAPNQLTDLPYIAGGAHCSDNISLSTSQIFQATGLAIPFALTAADKNLYALLMIRGGSQNFATTDAVNVSVSILQD